PSLLLCNLAPFRISVRSLRDALPISRILSVPWVGGEGTGAMTNQLLYPEYDAAWPTAGPANLGGGFELIPAFGLPLVNTLLLLRSEAHTSELQPRFDIVCRTTLGKKE